MNHKKLLIFFSVFLATIVAGYFIIKGPIWPLPQSVNPDGIVCCETQGISHYFKSKNECTGVWQSKLPPYEEYEMNIVDDGVCMQNPDITCGENKISLARAHKSITDYLGDWGILNYLKEECTTRGWVLETSLHTDPALGTTIYNTFLVKDEQTLVVLKEKRWSGRY